MTKATGKTQGEKQHPGTRKVGKIVKNASTPRVSIRGVAKHFNLSEVTLRFRRKKIQAGEPDLKKTGRKCAFDVETEEHLVKCIANLCNYGLSPSMLEIQVSLVLKILTTLLSTLLVLYKLFYCNN